MPNDYVKVRQARKGPKITLGQGMKRVEPETRELTPEEVRKEEIKNRGGAYSDRIKIEPKFGMEPREKPLPSDTEIQKTLASRVTKT